MVCDMLEGQSGGGTTPKGGSAKVQMGRGCRDAEKVGKGISHFSLYLVSFRFWLVLFAVGILKGPELGEQFKPDSCNGMLLVPSF